MQRTWDASRGQQSKCRAAFVCAGPDLYLLVPAIHLPLQNIDDLRSSQQHLLLLMELLLQGLQKLRQTINA